MDLSEHVNGGYSSNVLARNITIQQSKLAITTMTKGYQQASTTNEFVYTFELV